MLQRGRMHPIDAMQPAVAGGNARKGNTQFRLQSMPLEELGCCYAYMFTYMYRINYILKPCVAIKCHMVHACTWQQATGALTLQTLNRKTPPKHESNPENPKPARAPAFRHSLVRCEDAAYVKCLLPLRAYLCMFSTHRDHRRNTAEQAHKIGTDLRHHGHKDRAATVLPAAKLLAIWQSNGRGMLALRNASSKVCNTAQAT
jgi:hypothetical protein